MQRIYSIRQKITTAILLAAILGLVMWNNFEQTTQFKNMATALTSLYEDRLIAESYIYKISELLHHKSEILETPSEKINSEMIMSENIRQSDRAITNLIEHYQSTRFTDTERQQFDLLTQGLVSLESAENRYLTSNTVNRPAIKDSIKLLVDFNLHYLAELSEIQLTEGKKMNKDSKAALISNISSSQFENTMMILILIIIQMLLFAKKSIQGVLLQKPNLN